ncbi:MAG: AEC family transporter [Anaerolineae bacterium]|nr:AEC family transporter [Anaerolineae bacterium]
MAVFFDILLNIIAPIFVIMALGFGMNKLFRLDMPTLSRVTFYIFTPVVNFLLILRSSLSTGDVLLVGGFALAQQAVLFALAWALFSLKPMRDKRTVMTLSVIQYNAGNYGIPLVMLFFGEAVISVNSMVMMAQAIVLFTVGMLLMSPTGSNLRDGLTRLVRLPVLHSIWLGFLVRYLLMRFPALELPAAVQVPLDRVGEAYIAVALFTLGAELARTTIRKNFWLAMVPVMMRLIIGPLVTVALIQFFPLDPTIRSVLVAMSGLPIAVNIYLIATEFNHDAELASVMIFWTTLLSAVTLPVVLALVR